MILLIDNYDSFVYNLDRYLQRLGQKTLVVRSDHMSVENIARLQPEAIVISPGPKAPDDAGCSMEVIRRLGPTIPILGVCLGHQAIGQVYGGKVVRADRPVHGKSSLIEHIQRGIFEGLPSPLRVARYHSLVVEMDSIPDCLQPTAWCVDPSATILMACQHIDFPIHGVQFHPESILTEHGYTLLANFLKLYEIDVNVNIPAGDLKASESR